MVQPLSVAPDLVERGLTGEVLAGDLLDRLVSMQEQTDLVRRPAATPSTGATRLEVEIPQTGVSIGELQRFLRVWLGKETRISGASIGRAMGGCSSPRGPAGPSGVTFSGSDDELPDLMQKAAESVYARTQPYRYSVYLTNAGRGEEALPIYEQAARYGATEAAWLVRGWGLTTVKEGDPRRALEALSRSRGQGAGHGAALSDDRRRGVYLGHDEAAYQAYVRAARLIGRSREVDPLLRADYARREAMEAAFMVGDVGLADQLTAELEQMGAFWLGGLGGSSSGRAGTPGP